MSTTPNSIFRAISTVQDDTTELPQRPIINVIGATIEDNPDNNSTDITVGLGPHIGGFIEDNQIAVGSASFNSIEGSSSLTFDGNTLGMGSGKKIQGGGAGGKIVFGDSFDIDCTSAIMKIAATNTGTLTIGNEFLSVAQIASGVSNTTNGFWVSDVVYSHILTNSNSGTPTAPLILDTTYDAGANQQFIVKNNSDEIYSIDGYGAIFQANGLVTKTSALTTSNATPSTLFGFTLDDPAFYWFTVNVIGRKSDGSQRAFYVIKTSAYRQSGSATLGSVHAEITDESDASWAATCVVSGNDLVVQVTGVAATTINWKATVQYQKVV